MPLTPLRAATTVGIALTLGLGAGAPAHAAAPAGKAKATAKASAKAVAGGKKQKGKAKAKAKKRSTSPAKLADLSVQSLSLSVVDGELAIQGTLRNLGRKAAGASDLVVALSDGQTLSPGDDVLDELTQGRLASRERRAIDASVPLPEDVMDGDELRILVCADGNADVRERNERNNCAAATVVVDGLEDEDAWFDGDDDAAYDEDLGSDDPAEVVDGEDSAPDDGA